MNKYALVATLNNGRKVLVEPNHPEMKVAYRYLSDKELADETLYIEGKQYIWQEQPMHRTHEKGKTVVFATIEATPVVLARI